DQENAEENRKLFEGLKISTNRQAMALQGTRPVIFLSFKDCKASNWADMQSMIHGLLIRTAEQFKPCFQKEASHALASIQAVLSKQASYEEYCNFLPHLSFLCSQNNEDFPLILIDEYDVPLQTAWVYGYYEEAISFFRNFFSAAFKDNPYLWRGVMTGCLRISKESIFTGLNNLEVSSVVSRGFSSHFGLSQAEVKTLLLQYGYEGKAEAVEKWYNGYIFGNSLVYNPWSILNFLKHGLLKAYWVNTSSNDMVYSLLQKSSPDSKRMLEDLIAHKSIEVPLLEHTVFDLIDKDANNLWNFLYFTGYLKAESVLYPEDGELPKAQFKIPNQEVLIIFKNSILYWFQESEGYESLKHLQTYLKNGDGESFTLLFERLVSNSLSYFDVSGNEPERFYHAFTLGLIVSFSDTWHIRSNREAGIGRCDILMIPKNPDHFGVVIELKTFHPKFEKDLREAAQKAMQQIEDRQYAKELINQGCQKVLKIGAGFMGKQVDILFEACH
ncbi:MAG: AAA family ATPase, partial [Candidatus Cloacimonetes bacterium]|nr:AAA family ATPase [Candidatus Cloacimonadota bacterium]